MTSYAYSLAWSKNLCCVSVAFSERCTPEKPLSTNLTVVVIIVDTPIWLVLEIVTKVKSSNMNNDPHQTPFCPTCGRENAIRHSPEWLLTRHTGIFANILALLIQCRRERRGASKRDLCEAAYPDTRPVPITAPSVVEATIHRDRKALQAIGWDIVGPSITRSGYHLVALEPSH